ncbi:MAG: TonB-dependent receptor plug domain-containing protein [Prevotellaceae bacterium]|nr:TonB-dependent receptor plug domain-containing protein [Prevotellaceae bacterium]
MVRSFLLGLAFFIMPVAAFPQAEMPDTITLKSVHVYGKNRVRRVHDGAFNVNAIRIGAQANTLTDLNTLLDRSTGVRVRREGGLGADIDLSINGLSGNAVRYFIDGVPLETRGAESALSTIPVNIIHHVEVYKGVVPAYLGTDALGGAVNIVTKKSRNNFITVR